METEAPGRDRVTVGKTTENKHRKENRMSNFHSTISRREFMKALGFGAAGLGAAAAVAPVFHDLDEVASAKSALKAAQPWWVKEVDQPTVDIDWALTERFDMPERLIYFTIQDYIGAGKVAELNQRSIETKKEWVREQPPGNDLKSFALAYGAGFGWSVYNGDFPELFLGDPFDPKNITGANPYSYMDGDWKWKGTPEEANRILRAACKFYGATNVAFSQIYKDDFRKYFYIRGRDYEGPVIYDRNDPRIGQKRPGEPMDIYGVGKVDPTYRFGTSASPVRRIEFEDVDEPYQDPYKKVIPNSFRNLIVLEIAQDSSLTKRGPAHTSDGRGGTLGKASEAQAYGNLAITARRVQRFVKGLGYHCLSGGTGGLAPVTAWGVWSGLGELSRMNPMLTPEWGTMIRSTIIFVTDMPLAPTKPIDAGMFRFCHSCTKCAEACPYEALQMGKEPTWELEGQYNCAGAKKFMIKLDKCMQHRLGSGCDNCMSACPFSEGSTSFVHDFVRASIATTPVFNSFFYTMSKAFGYGEHRDPEAWWDADEPYGGLDTTIGTRRHHSYT